MQSITRVAFCRDNRTYVCMCTENNCFFLRENEGSGQQCCYDENEDLVVGPPGGGTVDLYAPNSFWGRIKHFTHDVLPFFYCC